MVADCPIRAKRIETVAAISVMATSSNGSASKRVELHGESVGPQAERARHLDLRREFEEGDGFGPRQPLLDEFGPQIGRDPVGLGTLDLAAVAQAA